MRSNSRIRTRLTASLALVGFVVAAILTAALYFRHAGTYHELTQARAILEEAENNAPASPPSSNSAPGNRPKNATEADLRAAVTALMPSSATREVSEPARLLLYCLSGIRTSPPWFDKDTLANVSQALDKLRRHERSTPDTEALDPATHTQDELRATVCAQFRASKAAQYLKDFGSTPAPSQTPRQPVNKYSGAEWELLPCLGCALADGDAQEAVSAYLQISGVNSHTCLTDYVPGRLDRMLPALIDLFPASVPDALAQELLTAIEHPVDLERAKQQLRIESAERVESYAERRSLEWQNAALSIFQVPAATLRSLVSSSETAGLIGSVNRALPLVDSPPYQVAQDFESIRASMSRSAIETRNAVANVARLCVDHHAHIAKAAITRSVLALKQYKADHGKYPETIDGLTPDPIPALPIDPLTGQALRYAIEGEGFAITSSTEPGTEPEHAMPLIQYNPIAWHAKR